MSMALPGLVAYGSGDDSDADDAGAMSQVPPPPHPPAPPSVLACPLSAHGRSFLCMSDCRHSHTRHVQARSSWGPARCSSAAHALKQMQLRREQQMAVRWWWCRA